MKISQLITGFLVLTLCLYTYGKVNAEQESEGEVLTPDAPAQDVELEGFEDPFFISMEEVFSTLKHAAGETLKPIQLVQYRGMNTGERYDLLARSFIRVSSTLIQSEDADAIAELRINDEPEIEEAVIEIELPDAEEDEEAEEIEEVEVEEEIVTLTPEEETPAPAAVQRKVITLSPETLQLHSQIKATLKAYSQKPLSLSANTPADLMNHCFVFGADAKVLQGSSGDPRQRNANQGNTIYTIGALCWNYPASGLTPLRADGSRVIAKLGPGVQRKPAQMLAMLAMSSIAENYEIKIQDRSFTVADLVKSEKDSCSLDADMSMALIGLSFYCDCEEEWTNRFGEKWTIPRMVFAELCRPAEQGNSQITDQLLGLACAVRRFENEGITLTGPMLDAKKYLDSYVDFSLTAMNEQGLWHPRFFLYKGSSNDARETLYSSGHIFRFVAFQIPEERLNDPRVVKSARALLTLVTKVGQTPSTTERQHESLSMALHGLSLYAERLDAFVTPGETAE